MKKLVMSLFFLNVLLIFPASAINLNIEKTPVSDVVISEINEPAIFNFTITNLGETDYFEIYSLVGVDFSPRGTFEIKGLEKKTVEVRVYPEKQLREIPQILNFAYKIKGQNSGIQNDILTIRIYRFEDAVIIGSSSIDPVSENAKVYIENTVNHNFENMNIKIESPFFSQEETISLAPFEQKVITIPLDRAKMKGLSAGTYILTGKVKIGDFKKNIEGTIKYLEKSGVSVSDKSKGIIIRERTIEKTNEGNVVTDVEANINKDIISRLFTSFSVEPTKTERKGIIVRYYWNRELRPGEILLVSAKTNYLYPLAMIIIIALAGYIAYLYKTREIVIKKSVQFVKTKGGEFALKVNVDVKAKKSVDKISIIETIPAIAKIYERFGTHHPDKIDHARGRIEWNINTLQPGEERVFSYIIYSKLAVMGRFELPATMAVYERDGKTKEASSNRAFFVNETREKED